MTNISIEELDPSGDLRQAADDAGAWDPSGTRRDLLRRAGIGGAAVFGVGALLSPLDAFASATAGAEGRVLALGVAVDPPWSRPNANDVKIGNYALTLEYLEAAFYAAAGGRATPTRTSPRRPRRSPRTSRRTSTRSSRCSARPRSSRRP